MNVHTASIYGLRVRGKNKSGRDEFWDSSRPLMATVTVLTPATV
jgi:hypothetical protein